MRKHQVRKLPTMLENQQLLQFSGAETLTIHHQCVILKGCSQLSYN